MPREFECRREVELPASPEQVWEAIATAAGNAAWLFPNQIDPGQGSTNPDGSAVTAWDPPRHFAVRVQHGDWFNALEYVIEGRDGATTLLRYAHSGIFLENWDTQYDAVQQHTDFYLHTLSEYLEHFSGRTATYIGDVPAGIQGPPTSAAPDGFQRLQQALGLPDAFGEGDHVRLTPSGLDPVEGVVDYVRPNFIGVRSADGLYCFFGRNAFGVPVGMSLHLFNGGVDAEGDQAPLAGMAQQGPRLSLAWRSARRRSPRGLASWLGRPRAGPTTRHPAQRLERASTRPAARCSG